MINLNRSVDDRWIIQKNISSGNQIEDFLRAIEKINKSTDYESLTKTMRDMGTYRGRGNGKVVNTMGVRLSQICFYMFGYKANQKFYPTPATNFYFNEKIDKTTLSLISLFSMQYPNPYSNTLNKFQIRIGRLMLKILKDSRVDKRLYFDEMIYFLPFINRINKSSYEELILSIQEYRTKNFEEKMRLFNSVNDSEKLFANCMHEMKYYFSRIFTELGCFEMLYDPYHNGGNTVSFYHGNGDTKRTDKVSRKSGGYIALNPEIEKQVDKLLDKFDAFEPPILREESMSREDWLMSLYEFEPLKYMNTLRENKTENDSISIIEKMIYESKYGSNDGKSFEQSLKPIFELFRENRSTEIISGSGDTDLLCIMRDDRLPEEPLYRINVDAKKSKNGLSSVNPARINKHIIRQGSKYCIIVSSRFSRGVKDDINNYKIATIEAETLAKYCLKECMNSLDGCADYGVLDRFISDNLGSDITNFLDMYTDSKYGIN